MMESKGYGRRDKRAVREGQMSIALDKLFYNKKFVADVIELRKSVGIPETGFSEFKGYYNFLLNDWHTDKGNYQVKIRPHFFKLGNKYGYPTNFVDWIEAFIALGYNYKKFKPDLPFTYHRELSIATADCALVFPTSDKDEYISLHIYPGAKQSAIKDFLGENWAVIKKILSEREKLGKAPAVRKTVKKVDADRKKEIFRLFKKGEIDSAGSWTGTSDVWGPEREQAKPKAIQGLSNAYIKKIYTAEAKKDNLRRMHKKPSK
jgi:hypothetical protein